jgi:hypothetical protein
MADIKGTDRQIGMEFCLAPGLFAALKVLVFRMGISSLFDS